MRRLVAIPGFINTHTHLWQHVAKGIAPSAQLGNLGPRGLWRRPLAHALRSRRDVTRAAAAEALLSGFTAVIDFAS